MINRADREGNILRKRGYLSVALCTIMTVSLFLWFFSPALQEVKAEEVPLYVGEGVAEGEVFLFLPSGQQLIMDNNPMPIFDKSRIQTGDGVSVISLVPDGLIEVYKESDVLLSKKGGKNILKVTRGVIRFSVPSSEGALSIITPSATVNVRVLQWLASRSDSLPPEGGVRAGVVEVVGGGDTFVTSIKGSLAVTTGDDKTQVVRQGETIKLAQIRVEEGVQPAQKNLLTGLSRFQLGALSAQKGVRILPKGVKVLTLNSGEIALTIPAEAGGGLIIGKPRAIAKSLNAIGISATMEAIRGIAVAESTGGMMSAGRYIAAGTLATGLGVVAGTAGGGGGGGEEDAASPSAP